MAFLEPVLYLVGLACSWEGSLMHLTILVDGHDMTLRDFLHFLRNRLVTVAAILDSTPLSVRSLGVPVVDLSDEDVEMQAAGSANVNVIAIPHHAYKVIVSPSCGSKRRRSEPLGGGSYHMFVGRHIGFHGPLASSEETGEIDPFLLGDDKAQVSHGILSGLPHLETQRRLDGLTLNELANFHDVSALRFVMSNNMLNREDWSLSG
ncbi:hypothetical protein Tco_0471443 [Tanacetum coccineum]